MMHHLIRRDLDALRHELATVSFDETSDEKQRVLLLKRGVHSIKSLAQVRSWRALARESSELEKRLGSQSGDPLELEQCGEQVLKLIRAAYEQLEAPTTAEPTAKQPGVPFRVERAQTIPSPLPIEQFERYTSVERLGRNLRIVEVLVSEDEQMPELRIQLLVQRAEENAALLETEVVEFIRDEAKSFLLTAWFERMQKLETQAASLGKIARKTKTRLVRLHLALEGGHPLLKDEDLVNQLFMLDQVLEVRLRHLQEVYPFRDLSEQGDDVLFLLRQYLPGDRGYSAEAYRRFEKEFDHISHRCLELACEDASALLDLISDAAQHLGLEQGIALDLRLHYDGVKAHPKVWGLLSRCLLQLLRNSLAHGYQGGQTRRDLAKPQALQLMLTIFGRSGELVVQWHDDGSGASLETLDESGLSHQLISEPGQLGEVLSQPGRSSFEQDAQTQPGEELAGQGMGVYLVRHISEKKLQGKFEARNHALGGLQVCMTIPRYLMPTQFLVVSTRTALVSFSPEGQSASPRYALPKPYVMQRQAYADTIVRRDARSSQVEMFGRTIPLLGDPSEYGTGGEVLLMGLAQRVESALFAEKVSPIEEALVHVHATTVWLEQCSAWVQIFEP